MRLMRGPLPISFSYSSGQVPIVAFFVIEWLPQTPRQALQVLALQGGAALAAFAAVFFLT
jgi:hypothetical protein